MSSSIADELRPRLPEVREPPRLEPRERLPALREIPPRLLALRELPRLELALRLRLPPRELLDCDDLAMVVSCFFPVGFPSHSRALGTGGTGGLRGG